MYVIAYGLLVLSMGIWCASIAAGYCMR